jgi:dCTP deaminase
LNGHLLATHRLADEWNVRNGIYEPVPGTHRRHVDFDRRNNRPTNIERMPGSEHIRLHNEETYGSEFDPDAPGASISQALRRLADDDEWRERFSAHRQAMLRRFADPAARLQHSESMRRAWAQSDASRHERQAEIARQIFRRFPEVVARFKGLPARNHKLAAIRELPGIHDVYCLTVPEAGNFALEAGVFVNNCGIIVNVTPLEPEWEGHVTLEFSNTTPLPAKIYANEGVAQMLFFESDEVCATSYADRGGKYQGQKGVTLPKT